jgi:superfamily I DNA/RNA helicase
MARVELPPAFFTIRDQIAKSAMSGKPWSSEQLPILDWFQSGEGNLVVRARAGTGKTTTLLSGINLAPERRILMAAFNKIIAEELQNRITNHNARVQTLHALGMSFCRRHISGLLVDTKGDRARTLASRAITTIEAGRKPKKSFNVVAMVAGLHTKIREILVDPADGLLVAGGNMLLFNEMCARLEVFAVNFGYEGVEDEFWSTPRVVEAALTCVEYAKEPTTTIDFADMIFFPLVHKWATPVCELIAIDEAQDMTESQLQLALASVTADGRVCVVGDDRQAIYGFRGADSGSLDRLKAELHADELGLKTTYRCPQMVVKLARHFVPDFMAADSAPIGKVRELQSIDKLVALAQPGDFILSRVNSNLVAACLELIRGGKKAYVKGKEFGREALKLLGKLETEPNTKFALCTDPVKKLKLLPAALENWRVREVNKLKSLSDKAATAKLARITESCDVLAAFVEGAKSTIDLHDKIEAAFSDTPHSDAIVCSTVHKAKGLEATRVFLLASSFNRATDEEDNICYVATTRAKKELYLFGKSVLQFTKGVDESEVVREAREALEGSDPDSDPNNGDEMDWIDETPFDDIGDH